MAHPGCDHHHLKEERQPSQRKRPSWRSTLLAQATLCLALHAAFNVWIPRSLKRASRNLTAGAGESLGGHVGRSHDLYFFSVAGGSRPAEEQARLLFQMNAVAEVTKVQFALVLSDVGEEDPLMQNATVNFPSLKIPWYVTKTSKNRVDGYFVKQVAIAHNQTLDIFVLDTGSLQQMAGNTSENGREQIHWLTKHMKESTSKWRVAVGLNPLIVCEAEHHLTWKRKLGNTLHHLFLRYRVSAYLSMMGCSGHYTRHSGITYVGHPRPVDRVHGAPSRNESSNSKSEMQNGFVLHRVNALEFESYFFNSSGHVISTYILHEGGRDVM